MASSPPKPTPASVEKQKKATPKPRSFLFINKDPESEILSRSSGQVATSINSHVQRWQDKKSGRSRAQPKTSTSQQPSETPAYRDCVTKFRPKSRKRPGKDVPRRPPRLVRPPSDSSSSGPSTAYVTTPEETEEIPRGDRELEIVKREVPSPDRDAIYTANFTGADCIDPFQSTNAHCPGVQPILQYYISFALVATFQSGAKSRREPPHMPVIKNIVRRSLSDKMHMYALLAATAARMKRVAGVCLLRESSPEFLLHNAIHCIREYLTSFTGPFSGDDRQIILDIFYLCVCEWYEKNYDVARTHLSFVRNFWKSLRPSDSFDKYVHDMITYNDVFLAIETASPPLFALTWEPPPLPTERIHEIEDEMSKTSGSPSQAPSSTLSSSRPPLPASTLSLTSIEPSSDLPPAAGFTALIASNSTQLPVELVAILIDLVPLIQTSHHHTHTPIPSPSKETQWVSLKTQALLHKLVSLQVQHPPFAEALRLSLIILLSCMSTSAAWRIGKVDMSTQASRLHSILATPPWQDNRFPIVVDNIHYPEGTSPGLSPSLAGADDTLLLWMLVTGAFAAQKALQEEKWFFVQAIPIARRLGIVDATRLKTKLLRYLYVDHLEGVTCERLCLAAGMMQQSPLS